MVYKAIDRDLGLEVAWNQIRLEQGTDFEKLWKEINILEQLKHPNIIVFHHSWVDEKNFHVIFITEYMTSGTLKQYVLFFLSFLFRSSLPVLSGSRVTCFSSARLGLLSHPLSFLQVYQKGARSSPKSYQKLVSTDFGRSQLPTHARPSPRSS